MLAPTNTGVSGDTVHTLSTQAQPNKNTARGVISVEAWLFILKMEINAKYHVASMSKTQKAAGYMEKKIIFKREWEILHTQIWIFNPWVNISYRLNT